MEKWIFAFVFQAIFGFAMYLLGYFGRMTNEKLKSEINDEE